MQTVHGSVAGGTVTVADAVLVLSAALVAVTVTVCEDATEDGAVYNPPAETAPTAGLIDQLTPEFDEPVTDAVNCCVCRALRAAEGGFTVTPTLLTGIPGAPTISIALMIGRLITAVNAIVIWPFVTVV